MANHEDSHLVFKGKQSTCRFKKSFYLFKCLFHEKREWLGTDSNVCLTLCSSSNITGIQQQVIMS